MFNKRITYLTPVSFVIICFALVAAADAEVRPYHDEEGGSRAMPIYQPAYEPVEAGFQELQEPTEEEEGSDSLAPTQDYLENGNPLIDGLAELFIDGLRNNDIRAGFSSWVLGKLGKSGINALKKALQSEDKTLKLNAIWALGESANSIIPSGPFWSVGTMGGPENVEPLVGLLNDQDPDISNAAAKALGKLHNFGTMDPLIDAVTKNYKTSTVQISTVANSLEEMHPSSAVQRILKRLEDKDPMVSERAAVLLNEIKKSPHWIVSTLIIERGLSNENPFVRQVVTSKLYSLFNDKAALEKIKNDPWTVRILTGVLKYGDPDAKITATNLLLMLKD